MKTVVSVMAFCMLPAFGMHAQTVTTTTIIGNLRVNDSLHVINNINSTGDIRASGEVISKDTMRAEKDVIVEGNAVIKNDLHVSGTAELNALRVSGAVTVNTTPPVSIDPCLKLLMAQDLNGQGQLITLSAAQGINLENDFDLNPCPEPPFIPFTWQTHGNHVNSNNRWIGTIENYDFNIKTNDKFQLICKANGDIGLGAFGGNLANTTGKKYRLFVANSGEVSAGIQDASGAYPFVVKPNGAVSIGLPVSSTSSYMLNVNGAVNIGTQFATSSPYMLTVNGRIGAREIKVSIQNPWPDYVFEKTYRLKSLDAVENYIAAYKHLPDVPSAEELADDECGLDLAKMQGMQMEKIEEIYLYLIELSKEVKELKKENATLKQQLTSKP
jgi:hypothetical protein